MVAGEEPIARCVRFEGLERAESPAGDHRNQAEGYCGAMFYSSGLLDFASKVDGDYVASTVTCADGISCSGSLRSLREFDEESN